MLPGLAGYTPVDLASSSPTGLALVEDKITEVLKILNIELERLHEVDFPVKGHISKASFGGGDRSPILALHHARAHGVVVTTLKDLRRDLRQFRDAIREARTLLDERDREAQSELLLVLQRTNDLDLGQNALPDAQVQHRNDVATDTPTTTEEQG